MDKKILVDTGIIIKAYRGNTTIYKQLLSIKEKFSISVVAAFELLNGAQNIRQLASTKKELKAYTILHFDDKVSLLALQLFSKYSISRNLQIPDLLIAATALHHNLQLFTDNKKHYNFIKGLKFYK